MGYLVSLSARVADVELLAEGIRAWFRENDAEELAEAAPALSEDLDPEILELLGDQLAAMSAAPTVFQLWQRNDSWVTATYETSVKVRRLATDLSASLDTTVAVIHGESNSDSYYLAVHERGEMIRELEYSRDSEPPWLIQSGEPLPQEAAADLFDRNNEWSDPDGPGSLSQVSLMRLCEELGLVLWTTDPGTGGPVVVEVA